MVGSELLGLDRGSVVAGRRLCMVRRGRGGGRANAQHGHVVNVLIVVELNSTVWGESAL